MIILKLKQKQVVQSVVSLTKSLVKASLSHLVHITSRVLIILLKIWQKVFAVQKLPIFSAKKGRVFAHTKTYWNFNMSLVLNREAS